VILRRVFARGSNPSSFRWQEVAEVGQCLQSVECVSKLERVWRDALASISQIAQGTYGPISSFAPTTLREPFAPTLRSVIRLLGYSTVGIAFFDADLRCRAFNRVLSAMIGASEEKHIGKNLQELFPCGSTTLELAFRRVWTTRNSLTNLELTVPLPTDPELRRWLVNLYPISDESGEVRLVAVAVSEITRERRVELKMVGLKDKFHSVDARQRNLLEAELSEMSTRTLEVVSRSVALLRDSLLLRFHASQVRLETGLTRYSLFLNATPEESSTQSRQASNEPLKQDASSVHAPDVANEVAELGPSPREREVLRFLADGKSNKEIGAILDISTRTVESYRARIMIKLNLHSTAALVRYAIRNNIVEP